MKITLLSYGSRGDVQPYLALAVGLQNAGHQVKLAAPHRFQDFVDRYRIPFAPLAGDPGTISQRLNNAGTNPIGMVRAISDYVFSIASQVVVQAFAACQDADLIVHSFLFTSGGHAFARKLNIPDISIQLFPVFAPTAEIPPPITPNLSSRLVRRLIHGLATQIYVQGGRMGYHRMRKAHPETFDLDLSWPFHPNQSRSQTALVFAYSPSVLPRPTDWESENIHVAGYLFLDTIYEYQPPEDLLHFMKAGPPPVCVTFGSTIHRQADDIYKNVISAIEEVGKRAIILSGWGGFQTRETTKNIFITPAVPHDWLLPQCQTVIHHGGAGSTAAGLRAGIPNLVVPFASEQPFWGMRVHAIGAGPEPIPIKKLTNVRLAHALRQSDTAAIRQKATMVGETIQAENGVKKVIEIIERLDEFK